MNQVRYEAIYYYLVKLLQNAQSNELAMTYCTVSVNKSSILI